MAFINDRDREFFTPLWRRLTLIAFLGAWAGYEYLWGDEMWGMLVLGIGALAFWMFFINFKPVTRSEDGDKGGDTGKE